MVDRQYDLMRRPRMMDEINNSKNSIRPDDVDMPNSVDHPAPNTATEAPVSDHEVSKTVFTCIAFFFRWKCTCFPISFLFLHLFIFFIWKIFLLYYLIQLHPYDTGCFSIKRNKTSNYFTIIKNAAIYLTS